MNKLRFIYTMCIFALGLLVAGCSKEEIPTYNEEFPSVTFPWTGIGIKTYPGYNTTTKKFEKVYSFWSDPNEEKVIVDIPLEVIGDVRSYDRKVNCTLDLDSCTLIEGSYKILEAVVPAGEAFGKISIEVTKLPALETETCVLELVLTTSDDFAKGPKEYIRAKFMFDNQLPMPRSGTFYCRTYNYLIAAGQSMNLANYNYYSKNAHKAILEALDWPWESDKWPAYNNRDPLGLTFYSTAQTNAYYDLLNAYLEAYEEVHGEPLLHDGGLAKGQPVKARKF
ncbi:hypothetical protein DMB45_08405 [Sanguibacteroides justesenii]|uniref:DUF4843 domain-containing protein n=1 Tax=Sanguibacteroides justesenii TaxID=1547597 RepID=UPI000D899838|nr:DUF4843 domain-containing protein [Sanguibacteroides justesenii]PXZ43982.1 hypothetical protein DMB45_08405 [Sanguibacteroides justesenii]